MNDPFGHLDSAEYALPGGLVERVIGPALVVYLDQVRANLRRVVELAGGDPGRCRLHVKTAKIPEIFAEMVAAGVRHFKCATTREAAELLAVLDRGDEGGGDLLVAYPLIGPALRRLGALAAAHPRTRISVLCEDPRDVDAIPGTVSIFVDFDPGMQRTGIAPDDVETALEVARRAGDRFRGVHSYEGHVQGSAGARRRMAHACHDRVMQAVERFRDCGIRVGEIVTSGTPAFVEALAYPGFAGGATTAHRVSPGTVVFHDLRSELEVEGLGLRPAALVLSRVVSHPGADRVTCDAGSKALAAEAGDPCAFVLGRPELEALTPSEEHLPLRVHAGPRPARGTPLLLVPRHVCPTVNLAEQALLIEAGRLREVVSVRARAHDLLVDVAGVGDGSPA